MKIQVELKKWGNSLGLRIPSQIAKSLDIAENHRMNLTVEGDRLIVESANLPPGLDEILESIPEDFAYPEDITDFAESGAIGQELL